MKYQNQAYESNEKYLICEIKSYFVNFKSDSYVSASRKYEVSRYTSI